MSLEYRDGRIVTLGILQPPHQKSNGLSVIPDHACLKSFPYLKLPFIHSSDYQQKLGG